MILCRKGLTLIEIIIVMIMIAVATAFFFPNFTASLEHARAVTAQNNLLAIYSAEQNYNNNYGNNTGATYCLDAANTTNAACVAGGATKCANNLVQINCNLSLNLQDDGAYTYSCTGTTCTATRNVPLASQTIVVTLNNPIALPGTNPVCNFTSKNWCP